MPPNRAGTGPISTTANSKLDHASHFIGSSALLLSSQLRKVQCYLLVEIVQMPSVTQHRQVARSSLRGSDVLCLQLADSRSRTLASKELKCRQLACKPQVMLEHRKSSRIRMLGHAPSGLQRPAERQLLVDASPLRVSSSSEQLNLQLAEVKHETAKAARTRRATAHAKDLQPCKTPRRRITFRPAALSDTIIAVSSTRSTDLLGFRAGSDAMLAVKDMTGLLDPLRYVCGDIAITRSTASTLSF